MLTLVWWSAVGRAGYGRSVGREARVNRSYRIYDRSLNKVNVCTAYKTINLNVGIELKQNDVE